MRTGASLGANICPECLARLEALPDLELLRSIATEPRVPSGFETSHRLCDSCLTVYRADARHERVCVISRAGLRIAVAGWTSGLTEALRADLRKEAPGAAGLLARVFKILVSPLIEGSDHRSVGLVPVPMASSGGSPSGLVRLVRRLGERLRIPVVEAVERSKRGSTRGSVAQERERIVEEEYSIVATRLPEIEGRKVLLIDDMITTGHTMSGVARLLLSAGAALILPVALDRTASRRLLQRLASVAPDRCPHR